ncbi:MULTISPECIES: hypothetical protein [Streptomyces]|uniref:hypothetical protein n=1 Tax=Streptomyces TaxID=1883 RepID=UPI0004C82627|nr:MULTISPECIES: hypothetical protein [Streptomyces]
MSESVIRIADLGLRVWDRPVATASLDLVEEHDGFADLATTLCEAFEHGRTCCEVGDALHTVSDGDLELRLRPRTDGSWHADRFPASWKQHPYEGVPAACRAAVASYVDRVWPLRECHPTADDLRAYEAEGGAGAVDRFVRRRLYLLDQQYTALEQLHDALFADEEGGLPRWALELVAHEAQAWAAERDHLHSATVSYHHGPAAHSPDMVFSGFGLDFQRGWIDLAARPGAGPRTPMRELFLQVLASA